MKSIRIAERIDRIFSPFCRLQRLHGFGEMDAVTWLRRVLPMNDGPDFTKNEGLLPVIAQDVHSGQVLMLGYMNAEAYRRTRQTGLATYYSRSRQELWQKGQQSGHVQRVKAILVDCDRDTILLQVEQEGVACHEGYLSCFFRRVDDQRLAVIAERLVDPSQVYGPD